MYLASPRCYTFIRSTNFITLFLNLVFLVSYLSHTHSDCTFLHIALCTSGSYKYFSLGIEYITSLGVNWHSITFLHIHNLLLFVHLHHIHVFPREDLLGVNWHSIRVCKVKYVRK
ncbi:hypothetical protein B0H11DRAFT_1208457 [Mycena galericulata]|nr:hypothetical protein B0H11DRAFT_1208457 [Mycena galericulata]